MNKFTKSTVLAGMLGASTIALAMAMSTSAFAQTTSSSVRGVVTNEAGSPVSGASVSIVHVPSGTAQTAVTGANGVFVERGLRVGGPYIVTITANGQAPYRAEGIQLSLGETYNFSAAMGGATSDEIIVTGSLVNAVDVALGPNATFSLDDLQRAPTLNRDITDVLRSDPRIYISEAAGARGGVSCGGLNPRFNSLTVDGIRMNDSFGLNSNGYPTERIPFSFDAIEQVAVEMAPFDVQYGGFTACNINAVTKSGGNEIHGGLFFDYTNDGLRNNSLEGSPITTGEFSEIRYGFNVGGPIIKDKLFLFAAYEKLEGANLFDRGPIGSGAVNEVNVTDSDLTRIEAAATSVYGYDAGGRPQSFDNKDEKILVKLDWNINADHRASFTYNYNDGFNISGSDRDLNEYEFSNHLYERGAKLESYSGTLYSDWNENFSTELRAGYLKLDNRQISVGGTDFGEMQIRTAGGVTVYLGGDDSRQSNKLNYDLFNFALKGTYTKGNHTISGGFERESLDVFNLFIQHTETEIRFTSVANFENALADRIYYNNAPSHNPDDAAAEWGYALNSIYAQDEIDMGNGLTLLGGLRYDWYTTSDLPTHNPIFQDGIPDDPLTPLIDESDPSFGYGFSNSQNLDGEGLLQPRFGFNWEASDTVTLHGGVGRYSGGNPNVWLSNTFSGNNIEQVGALYRAGRNGVPNPIDLNTLTYSGGESGVPNFAGYAIPDVVYDQITTGIGSNFELNYLDPNFKIPSEWKFSLGGTFEGPNGYFFTADALYSKAKNTAIISHGDLDPSGNTVSNGTPEFDSNRLASFVLTNSDVSNESFVLSASVNKQFDNGIDWSFGYAHVNAKDVQPMTSAVAFSNYMSRAFANPEEQVLSTSNYEIPHRFTSTFSYEHAFFGDNMTKFSALGQYSSGIPYSFTQPGNGVFGFTPFLEGSNVLADGFERNDQKGSWWGKVDIKVEQEFPGFREHDKASVFMVINNFTNLINDDWGVLRQAVFPGNVDRASFLDPVNPLDPEARIGAASRYEVRFGAKYDF